VGTLLMRRVASLRANAFQSDVCSRRVSCKSLDIGETDKLSSDLGKDVWTKWDRLLRTSEELTLPRNSIFDRAAFEALKGSEGTGSDMSRTVHTVDFL
jgi:hypothetical protein